MKTIISTLLIATVLFSCSKSTVNEESDSTKEWYRVSAIGSDTTRTTWMGARTESSIVLVEDSRLRAELIAYQNINGKAYYTVRLTNRQGCQMISRWNWENLAIESVQPTDSTANTAKSDVLLGNQVKTFVLIGKPVVGKITVKAEKSNSDCPNSSTLVIPITMDILPIVFLENTVTKDKKTGKVTVKFTVDDPSKIDSYLIERIRGEESSHAALIVSDKVTKSFSIKL